MAWGYRIRGPVVAGEGFRVIGKPGRCCDDRFRNAVCTGFMAALQTGTTVGVPTGSTHSRHPHVLERKQQLVVPTDFELPVVELGPDSTQGRDIDDPELDPDVPSAGRESDAP